MSCVDRLKSQLKLDVVFDQSHFDQPSKYTTQQIQFMLCQDDYRAEQNTARFRSRHKPRFLLGLVQCLGLRFVQNSEVFSRPYLQTFQVKVGDL